MPLTVVYLTWSITYGQCMLFACLHAVNSYHPNNDFLRTLPDLSEIFLIKFVQLSVMITY